jgi:hypothetical protein
MLRLRSEIDRASKYVKNAAVHMVAHLPAQVYIKNLRVPAPQFRHIANSQTVKVGGYRWPDSGDALERL